jgi:hypothetical protein
MDDVQLQAISLFFRDYIVSACGICTGWLPFLPEMYRQSTKTSLIYQAVCTVAYANLAQKTERPDIAIRAASHYGTSLDIVKFSLYDKLTATSDTVMTTVTLLLLYEVSRSRYP